MATTGGQEPGNALVVTLKGGDVVIEMLPDVAPKHVEQIKALARAGEYDNVAFHRGDRGFHGPDRGRRERRHGAGLQPRPRRHRRLQPP